MHHSSLLITLFTFMLSAASELIEVHGVKNAGVRPRLELRDLAANTAMLNLFLQGLERFQATDQSDPDSYFEIAGIHGVPYRSWQDISPRPGASAPGYCPHFSNVFFPWHRPYLALFEQSLYKHILDVVRQFPEGDERDQQRKVADAIRLPYWDWALPLKSGPIIPEIMSNKTIVVKRPNGTEESIQNPLYSYRFHPHNPDELNDNVLKVSLSDQLYQFISTKRSPTSSPADNEDAPEDLKAAEERFSTGIQQKRDRLFNLLWKNTTYSAISNHGGQADNFEEIHGWAHLSIGGTNGPHGHMTETPMSAFDPSFWLHHAMMDRLIAIWQRLHPETYVEPQSQDFGTWAYSVRSTLDANSSLYPFPKSQDEMWTSNEVRDTRVFGYTYVELQLPKIQDIKAAVNTLYNDNPSFGKRSMDNGTRVYDPTADFIEYNANVAIDQMAVGGGSFAVYFFLGTFSQDTTDWDYDDNLIGTEAILSIKAPHGDSGPSLITGSVPLTRSLRARWENGRLESLDEDKVIPYLQEHLHWRVRRSSDGAQVPVSRLPSLAVSVVSSLIRPAQSEGEFPRQLTDTKTHPEVVDHNEGDGDLS
ncbi:Di-copper centre-containing protein [Pseudovirgaria hyperparasitica]|uniref:tyrosinase n=1 Tax=Pseudovirgaria hyperparasitica TaxID=470096 RepID=A0A6A6WEL2_9PEZI|nr:Di-copper centre-containing protein [Pseudovirgaria hyperparasitica]KAF2760027.1 Di-copper centre-containing protein [Pseudovirgaria hyperparasitica]